MEFGNVSITPASEITIGAAADLDDNGVASGWVDSTRVGKDSTILSVVGTGAVFRGKARKPSETQPG